MKTNRLFYAAFLVFLIHIISCATDYELKKQGEATRLVGEAYMSQGDDTAALNELLKAEKIYSKDPHLHNDLGLVYMSKDKLDLAINHFKRAIELKPDYAPARNNLGTAYLAKKDWDSAITCFKEVTKDLLYATPHYPLSNLGWAYYNKNDFKAAEQYYKEALKIEPNFSVALHGLGLTYHANGKGAEAAGYIEKAIRYSTMRPELYMDLARAYVLLKEYTKAVVTYNKVIEIAPESLMAIEAKKEIAIIQKEYMK
jgi:type IV pilus assembly protein PilF